MKAFLISLLLLAQMAGAHQVRIGLFWGQNITNLILTPTAGRYDLIADGKPIASLDHLVSVLVVHTKDSVIYKVGSGPELRAARLVLASGDSSHFKVRPVSPDLSAKSFHASVEITSVKNSLKLVNVTSLEIYIAGVIESEVGPRAPAEYYKSQAILCRTYALSHLRRHEAEDFNLCDRVHCQVYKSRSVKNPKIIEAARYTRGQVLVDEKLELITAAFHSNCGGQTANSEDVWNKSVSYLKSVKDTFCLREPNARWVKEIPQDKWMNYLSEVCSYPTNDSNYRQLVCSTEPKGRTVLLGDKIHSIQTKEVRNDFNLKSAYFGIRQEDLKIKLEGKGYGHGVGLCQEGAMRMARLGYSFSKILHFYYTGVNIVNLTDLDFFKAE